MLKLHKLAKIYLVVVSKDQWNFISLERFKVLEKNL